MTSLSLTAVDKFMRETILRAGKISLSIFGKAKLAYSKQNIADVVTQGDLQVEKMVLEAIRRRFPDHAMLSEEGHGTERGSEYQWILDPIDGTRNFLTDTPLYGVMLALAQRGRVIRSAIFLPYFDEFYFARFGKGATCNGKRINCSTKADWKFSYGCMTVNFIHDKAQLANAFMIKALRDPVWISGFGSIAISAAYVASGRRDWTASLDGNAWDYAPTSLLLQESGCKVTDRHGNPWRVGSNGMIAANKKLYPTIAKIVTKIPENT